MRRQTEHRIRAAAGLARPGRIWLAALLMNAHFVAGAAVVGWFAFTSWEPAVQALAGILFALALLWALLATLDSWRVLDRLVRRRTAVAGHLARSRVFP